MALLHRVDRVAVTGGDTFLDMADFFARLVDAEVGVSRNYRVWAPILEQLHSDYINLIEAANLAHDACARYLFSCRRALDPTTTDMYSHTQDGLHQEFRNRCGEVSALVPDMLVAWEEAVEQLPARIVHMPTAVESLVRFLVPDCLYSKRRTILEDLPSVDRIAQQNLHRFATEYTKLEATLMEIESTAKTTSVPDADAASERCRNLRIVIYCLIDLDSIFWEYRSFFVEASNQKQNWPPERLNQTPLGDLSDVESDYVANWSAYQVEWIDDD
ncbi:hypothetical protein B0H11DRAFT_2215984 [Mycena galericulata]|nr:hypothetical protein B0H11DRAFT_2215984 [Mycena galericulata]